MRRIQHATRVVNGNGAGRDGFGEGNVSTQVPATVITAEWLNDVQEELLNVITSAGLTPSTSRTQLADAIAIAATGSASANAISIQGRSVLNTAPVAADVLQFTGTAWAPGKIIDDHISTAARIGLNKLWHLGVPDGYQLNVSGGAPTWRNGAAVIQGVGVSSTTPAANDVLISVSGSSWQPGKVVDGSVATNAAVAVSKLSRGTDIDNVQLLGISTNGSPAWFRFLTAITNLPAQSDNLVVPNMDAARVVTLAPGGGNYRITGFQTTSAAADAKIIVNNSGFSLTIAHGSNQSSVSNQITTPTFADVVIGPYRFALLWRRTGTGWWLSTPA